MFTKQETINQVWPKLVASGFAHSMSDDGCMYRGPNGTKCAIGHLIPDDKYSAEFEGKGIPLLTYEERKELGIADHNYEFLRDLQVCHDFSDNNPEVYKEKVLNLIHDHDLVVP